MYLNVVIAINLKRDAGIHIKSPCAQQEKTLMESLVEPLSNLTELASSLVDLVVSVHHKFYHIGESAKAPAPIIVPGHKSSFRWIYMRIVCPKCALSCPELHCSGCNYL